MSNNSLASSYSRATGLALNKPFINMLPYPLPFDKYICLHSSSGNATKNYDYWQLVIDFIKPELDKLNINIIQLGGKDDILISGCFHLNGKTSLAQTAFIIKNSLLLLGNDSMLAHMAGILDVDVLALYGCTSATAHGPHWKTDKTLLIESNRNGKLPSFVFNESPKTVNMISPEEIVDGIYSILGIGSKSNLTSINIGSEFTSGIIEVVPDVVIGPDFLKGAPIVIRYDYLENANNLANQLSIRPSIIVTDRPININILKNLKKHVLQLKYEITENHDPKFASEVRKLGIGIKLYSKLSEDKVNNIKLDYFDIGIIDLVKIYKKDDIKKSELITTDTYFKTNKVILSNQKIYSSNIHRLLDLPQNNISDATNKIIDTPKFFEELEHFYIFNKN